MIALTLLLSGSAVVLPAAGDAPDSAAQVAVSRPEGVSDEIVVVGKSFGNDQVGKTLTPLKDVPNTVSLVDRAQIEAQNLFTLEDALTITPGITVTGIGSEDPSFVSRGFAIDNYLIDGVPTLSFGFPGVVPDLFFYERLEVLRGPAGLFSGSGNPAGSINLVRKRPLDVARIGMAAGYGSFDNVRLELDTSVPVGERAGVRAGAFVQDQDQFFDVAHRTRWGFYGTGQIDLGARTTLTVGGNLDHFEPAVQTGLPGFVGGQDGSEGRLLDVPRSTYLGADWNRFSSDSRQAFVELTHRAGDRWTLRATGLIANVDRIDVYSYIGNQPITPANAGTTNHIAFRGDSFQKTRSVDVNVVGAFTLLGRDQTLIAGIDYQARSFDSYFTRLGNYARINVFNPVSPAEPPLNPYGPLPYYPVQGTGAVCPSRTTAVVPAPANCVLQVYGGTRTEVEQYGLYGQLRISPVAGLTLVGGGRLTWWDTNGRTLVTPAATLPRPTGYLYDGRFTPYAGVVFDVTDNLNLYASYADSFTPLAPPANRVLPDGGEIRPLIGDQYEAGTKLALMGDRLLLTLAGYQITQSNRIFNDPDDQTIFYQIGRVRARGIEASAFGEILPGWTVNGGYTYTRTEYLEDANPTLNGLPLTPIIPDHMVKLFTNYAPVDGPLAGASIGGAVTWLSETYGGNAAVLRPNGTVLSPSTVVRQGGYAVVDLRAGYRLSEQLSVSVNVNNLLDRTYYARIASTGRGNFFGSPRSLFATVRFDFR